MSDEGDEAAAGEGTDPGADLPAAHRTRSRAKASTTGPLPAGAIMKNAPPRTTAARKKVAAQRKRKQPLMHDSEGDAEKSTPLTSGDWEGILAEDPEEDIESSPIRSKEYHDKGKMPDESSDRPKKSLAY